MPENVAEVPNAGKLLPKTYSICLKGTPILLDPPAGLFLSETQINGMKRCVDDSSFPETEFEGTNSYRTRVVPSQMKPLVQKKRRGCG